MQSESPFYKTALKFIPTNGTGVPVVGDSQYIALTPFPEGNPQIPTLPKIYQNVRLDTITEPCDIYHPLDLEEFKKSGEILYPKLNPKTILIFLETTQRTISSGIVHSFVENMKKIAEKRIPILISVFCFGHTLKFPFSRKDFTNFSISTNPDFDGDFFVPPEHTYFDLKTQSQPFIRYLEEIDKLQPEVSDVSLGRILLHMYTTFKAIRNPCFFITCDAPDASETEIEEIINKFAAPHLSLQFMIIGNKNYPNINKLVKATNTHILHFGFNQMIFLINELIKFFILPYTRFACVYAIGTDSVKIDKCIANYSTCVGDRFCFNKILFGDTMHFFIKIDKEKAKKVQPRLKFIIQYFDNNVQRYKRIIPINISMSSDPQEVQRNVDPNSIVCAAAAQVAEAFREGKDTDKVIESLHICMISDYFRDVWDKGIFERVRIASQTMKYIATEMGVIEFLHRSYNDVLSLLSPICVSSTNPDQVSVIYKEIFQNSVAIEAMSNHYLCFDGSNGGSATELAIKHNPKCFIEKIDTPIVNENSYHADILTQILSYI